MSDNYEALIAEARDVRDGHQAFAVIPRLVEALEAARASELEESADILDMLDGFVSWQEVAAHLRARAVTLRRTRDYLI